MPGEQYAARLADREARIAALQRASRRFATARLALAGAALAMAWMAWFAQWFPAGWLALPVVAFAATVAAHAGLRRRLDRALRQRQFYRQAMARIEDRWAGTGVRERPEDDVHHLYAADLDLFGEGSLFELLCAARTAMGEQTLSAWLLAPAGIAEIRSRHASIDELRERLDLREEMAVLGEEGLTPVRPQDLLEWAESANRLGQRWIGALAMGLPAALCGAALWGLASGTWLPAIAILVLEAGLLYRLSHAITPLLSGAAALYEADGLRTLAQLLSRIEQESFACAPLLALRAQLDSSGSRSSAAMSRLAWIAAFAEARDSLMVRWFLSVPLLYPVQVALAAERWRGKHAAAVPRWLDATGRFEALICLAQYRFEHPRQPYPQFTEEPGVLDARGLAHPLLPAGRCVRNDVKLSAEMPVLLVSGSNMSGKSTLLRAVGLNIVLAMAGAPVDAESLRLAPLTLGASIRVNDSLREGQSRFSAELSRLRQIVALAEGGAPLLFLIDELLQGTNSNDRRIGAEGLLGALINLRAVGIVTTHDLALTELPRLAGRVRNVHLRETMRAGQMHFDYTLRPGVLTTSNGLELMRAMGLRV
ncbi:MAG: MutS-related protein [Steroidobacteraceae bacterium]